LFFKWSGTGGAIDDDIDDVWTDEESLDAASSASRSGRGEDSTGRRVSWSKKSRMEALRTEESTIKLEWRRRDVLASFEDEYDRPARLSSSFPFKNHFQKKLWTPNEFKDGRCPFVAWMLIEPGGCVACVKGERYEGSKLSILEDTMCDDVIVDEAEKADGGGD
jgi:hypothetical protein